MTPVTYIRAGETHSTFIKISSTPETFAHDPAPIVKQASEIAAPLVPPGATANALAACR